MIYPNNPELKLPTKINPFHCGVQGLLKYIFHMNYVAHGSNSLGPQNVTCASHHALPVVGHVPPAAQKPT